MNEKEQFMITGLSRVTTILTLFVLILLEISNVDYSGCQHPNKCLLQPDDEKKRNFHVNTATNFTF